MSSTNTLETKPADKAKDAQFIMEHEALVKAKRRARIRFKALVKRVIENKSWLRKGLVDNVVSDLHQPAEDRTELQINRILNLMSEFSCFDLIGDYSKEELAKFLQYQIVEPGRRIVQQGSQVWAMYVIMSGEVQLSLERFIANSEFSETKKRYEHAGYIFGHFGVLFNLPRRATITSSRLCELLVVSRDSFDKVLRQACLIKYTEVNDAMNTSAYFDTFDLCARQDIFLLGRVVRYKENEVVYSLEKSPKDSFFILQGRCSLIERLRVVRSSHYRGHDNFERYGSTLNSTRKSILPITPTLPTSKSKSTSKTILNPKRAESGMNNMKRLDLARKAKSHISDESVKNDTILVRTSNSGPSRSSRSSKVRWRKSTDINFIPDKENQSDIFGSSNFILNMNEDEINKASMLQTKIIENKTNRLFRNSYACRQLIRLAIQTKAVNIPVDEYAIDNLFQNMTQWGVIDEPEAHFETHFVKVATFNNRACFNIGENMENRNVVAQTDIVVLRIPKYILMQQTLIWEQMRQQLNDRLPSSGEIFNSFIKNRIYLSLRREMISKLITPNISCRAKNSMKNVPYSIRLRNDFDFTDKYHRLQIADDLVLKNSSYYANTIQNLLK